MNAQSLPLPVRWLQPFDFPHKLGICERLFGKRLSVLGSCWVQTAAGISWKLDLANSTHRWIVYGKIEGEAINVVRLADELAVRSIERVDLWKLDVEGYEVPALQGAEALLREHRIAALYVELAGDNGQRVCDYLSLFNYRCYLFDRKG